MFLNKDVFYNVLFSENIMMVYSYLLRGKEAYPLILKTLISQFIGTSVALFTKVEGDIKVKVLSENYAAKRDGSIIAFDLLCKELM